MKFKFLLLTISLVAITGIARANSEPGTDEETRKNDIAGGVTEADTKKPIGNVSVTAYSNLRKEKIVMTDGNGNYAFSELKPGTYKLVFEKTGYKKVIKEKVNIKSEEGYQLNIEMDEEQEFHIVPGQIFSDFE